MLLDIYIGFWYYPISVFIAEALFRFKAASLLQ